MYEIFEHTADVGLRAKSPDLDQLFADAARGLFSLVVVNLDEVRPRETFSFTLPGSQPDELLHDWLAELLYTFETRHVLLAEFDVHVGPEGLTAEAQGEPIDFARHQLDMEVKAITWHGLKVEREPSGWRAEVIVDI